MMIKVVLAAEGLSSCPGHLLLWLPPSQQAPPGEVCRTSWEVWGVYTSSCLVSGGPRQPGKPDVQRENEPNTPIVVLQHRVIVVQGEAMHNGSIPQGKALILFVLHCNSVSPQRLTGWSMGVSAVVGRCSWMWVLDNVPTNHRVTFDSWGDANECGVWTALTHSSTSWMKCVGENNWCIETWGWVFYGSKKTYI